MEMKGGLNQISYLIGSGFSFANKPLFWEDIPDRLKKSDNVKKVMNYNNVNKGIITNDFFAWALENVIPYDVIKWFVKDFSCQNNQELYWLIDALFNHYTIYLDESNNCVKFRFKDIKGNTNVKWYNDFVLSGIAIEGNVDSIVLDRLFEKFKLQKNITDVKLKHIANYNGEDGNRFADIMKSKKVSVLLETLLQIDNIYIHWATENLVYFSLVDIVDSVLEVPVIHDGVKNVLYKYAIKDKDFFLSLLAQYDYPNIKKNKIKDFCEEFICWIDSIETYKIEEDFLFELLRQGIKSSRKKNNLLFLHDNTDKLLIENFVSIYAMRIAAFPNSDIHFDRCGIVEDNIKEYVNIFCSSKIASYDFMDSDSNRWIQLSDMVSGIHGALMAYINIHDINGIIKEVSCFNDIQKRNLRMFMKLKKKSCDKNKYFDNMSKNVQQIICIQFLMDYCNM